MKKENYLVIIIIAIAVLLILIVLTYTQTIPNPIQMLFESTAHKEVTDQLIAGTY